MQQKKEREGIGINKQEEESSQTLSLVKHAL